MSDTPRTDQLNNGLLSACQESAIYNFMLDNARQLERERDEAFKKLAVFQELLNGLAGPLEVIMHYWDQEERLESMTAACWNAVETAEKALQKIKPHLTLYDR